MLAFSRPSLGEDEIAEIVHSIKSGWITTGPKCHQFEKDICDYVGAKHAVALTSATAGLHLALLAAGIGPGDEVITTSLTFASTANMIVLVGAKPVFVDIGDDLNIDPALIEAAITPRTKAIIPVHFAGYPCDMDRIMAIAGKHRLVVIEDAAHAIGTDYRGRRIGSIGDMTIFSFHPIKNITTGEGGMFCSDDEELLDRIRRLKFHGLGVDAYDRRTQGRSPQAEVIEPGYKYNMTDLSAALGLSQLARVDAFNARRTELASAYRERLAEVEEIVPLRDPPYPMTHAWHLFIVRVNTGKSGPTRDEFMKQLKQRNIGTGLHFRAVHLQKYYREAMGMRPGMLPNTEWNSDRICSLPLFPDMTLDDVDDVVAAVKDVLSQGRPARSWAASGRVSDRVNVKE